MVFTCSICGSTKHGKVTTICNHELCGKCFITLHSNALEEQLVRYLAEPSKCPFCRQRFPFEMSSLRKMRAVQDRYLEYAYEARRIRRDIRKLRRLKQQLS